MLSRATSRIFNIRTATGIVRTAGHPLSSTFNSVPRVQVRMSSSSNTVSQREWLVHIPDHPGALDKRLAVRADHLSNVKPDVDAGRIVMGGAVLSKHPSEGEAPDMTGSIMLIKADTEEEVREWMAKDVYTKGGAWDVANAKIWPFRCAVRTAI